MVDSALLVAVAERRARYYLAGDILAGLQREIRSMRGPGADDDPFRIVRNRRRLKLA